MAEEVVTNDDAPPAPSAPPAANNTRPAGAAGAPPPPPQPIGGSPTHCCSSSPATRELRAAPPCHRSTRRHPRHSTTSLAASPPEAPRGDVAHPVLELPRYGTEKGAQPRRRRVSEEGMRSEGRGGHDGGGCDVHDGGGPRGAPCSRMRKGVLLSSRSSNPSDPCAARGGRERGALARRRRPGRR